MWLKSRNLTHNYTELEHFLAITHTGRGHHPHAVRILWSVQQIVKMDCQPLWRILPDAHTARTQNVDISRIIKYSNTTCGYRVYIFTPPHSITNVIPYKG